MLYVDELKDAAENLNSLPHSVGLTATALAALQADVNGVREDADTLLIHAKRIHDSLQMVAVNWEGYDIELDRVTAQIGGLEERLKSIVCALPPSLEEAKNNLEIIRGKSSLDSGVQALHVVAASLVTERERNTQGIINKSQPTVDLRLDKLKRRAEEVKRSLIRGLTIQSQHFCHNCFFTKS